MQSSVATRATHTARRVGYDQMQYKQNVYLTERETNAAAKICPISPAREISLAELRAGKLGAACPLRSFRCALRRLYNFQDIFETAISGR